MSLQLSIDEPAFALARSRMLGLHDDLRQRRDRLQSDAQALLADGWTGVAAGQYAEAWDDWRLGADRALRSLLDLVEAMGLARAELVAADEQSLVGLTVLRARLGAG